MSRSPGASGALASFGRLLSTGLAPRACGFLFDFDGTLAPIQLDPETVQPVTGAGERLTALSAVAATVAIVSARPAAFLQSRFPEAHDLDYFGLYGIERARGTGPVMVDPHVAPYAEVATALAEQARAELPAGTMVEHKSFTVALHYRQMPSLAETVRAWAQAKARQHGLQVQLGRMVCELKPPTAHNKGEIVREIVKNVDSLRYVWYFGDDLGDIAAFEALGELAAASDAFGATRVLVANPETGDALKSLADVELDGPAQLPAFLDRILDLARRHVVAT